MKYTCIESTLELKIEKGLIRLWINEDEIKQEYYSNIGIEKQIKDFITTEIGRSDKEIIEFIVGNVPRVNAVQLFGGEGEVRNGIVVYTVDFDIKG